MSHPAIRSWATHMAAVTGRIELTSAACEHLVEQYHDGTINDANLLPGRAAPRLRHSQPVTVLRPNW